MLKWEFKGSKEQAKTTKYMDFGATKDLRKPSILDFILDLDLKS